MQPMHGCKTVSFVCLLYVHGFWLKVLIINRYSTWSAIAVDERCDMELDETDPAIWLKLEAAVEEYIQNNYPAFKKVCERLLLPYQNDDKWSENMRLQHHPNAKGSSLGTGAAITVIGSRRNLCFWNPFFCGP